MEGRSLCDTGWRSADHVFGASNNGVTVQIGRVVLSDENTWVVDTEHILVPVGPKGAWDDVDVETPLKALHNMLLYYNIMPN
jgi:hypothetical protein